MKIKIFNENCFDTMDKMVKWNKKVDVVLTSPPTIQGNHQILKQAETTMMPDMIFIWIS